MAFGFSDNLACPKWVRSSLGEVGKNRTWGQASPLAQGLSSGAVLWLVLSEPTARQTWWASGQGDAGDKTGGGVDFEVALGYFPSHHCAGGGSLFHIPQSLEQTWGP